MRPAQLEGLSLLGMPTTLAVIVSDDTHTHVQIIGPLDLAAMESIALKFTASTASRRKHAIVDMSQVPFVASLGIGLLVQVARALAASRCRLVLLNPTPLVEKPIRAAKLDALIPIVQQLEAAHACFATPAPA
jgi:anti-sigma B factor antagonist